MRKFTKLGIPLRSDDGLGYPIVYGADRYKHLFILGTTGAGKTSYLLNLIRQENENAQIILDPGGDLAEKAAALAPADRLIYIDKNHPISLNPLSRPDLNKADITNEFVETINTAVSAFNPGQPAITVLMAKIIRNALRVFTKEQMNIKYLGEFLEYDEERKKVPDKFWQNFDKKTGSYYLYKEQVESAKRISARLSLYSEDENLVPFILGENEFYIPDIARNRKIVVFNLNGFDDEATAFIGCLATHQLKSYYLHQAKKIKSPPPLYFYCDEYHLFINPLFQRFLAEARKHNISINLAGHSFSQVSQAMAAMVIGNCFVKVCLQADVNDAEAIARQLNIKIEEYFGLEKHEAILGIGSKFHKILTYPPPQVEPYIPPENPSDRHRDGFYFLKPGGWIQI